MSLLEKLIRKTNWLETRVSNLERDEKNVFSTLTVTNGGLLEGTFTITGWWNIDADSETSSGYLNAVDDDIYLKGDSRLYLSGGADVYVQGTDEVVILVPYTTYITLDADDVEIKTDSGSTVWTFAAGGLSTFPGDLTLAGDVLPISTRILGFPQSSLEYHFDGDDYPMAGFSWATYSPFGTQSPVITASLMRLAGNVNQQGFYSRSDLSIGGYFLPFFSSPATLAYVGIRYDDGTDNNWMMVHATSILDPNGSGYVGTGIGVSRRVGGGAVATTYGTWLPLGSQLPVIRCHQEGTQWSNWTLMPMVYCAPNAAILRCPKPYSASFTPTRMGFAFGMSATSWRYVGLDYGHIY